MNDNIILKSTIASKTFSNSEFDRLVHGMLRSFDTIVEESDFFEIFCEVILQNPVTSKRLITDVNSK